MHTDTTTDPWWERSPNQMFFAHEIWTQNLAFWRDVERVLAKEICFHESCACREGDISENCLLVPKEPKSCSYTAMPSDCWGLGRRNSPATFRDIHQNCKEQRVKSAWENISAGLALLSLAPHISGLLIGYYLSWLVLFVQTVKGKACLLRSLPVQWNNLQCWLPRRFSDLRKICLRKKHWI